MAGQSEISSGTMLDDRYRIDELLSVGGMGAVYAGTHVLLQKRVAIKVLRSELPHAHLMMDRFHREAVAASAIGHENIVEVTDMGLLPSGIAYLVMELLEGQSLREVMKAEAPMAIERACRICCEILSGVGAAHQAGIVHRDLKPDNIFVAKKGKGKREVIKIVDFGVSLLKRPNVPDTRLTSTGVIVGTPRYMSPEQAKGEQDLSGAVDIYAAGVVLYEMLTGQLPYFGENYNVIVHEIMGGKWMPLETRRPEVPREVCQVVRRAMALAPRDRFASAEDMVAALEPFAGVAPGPATASRSVPIAASPAGKVPVALAATEMATVPGRLKKSTLNDPTPDPAWADRSRPGTRSETVDPFMRSRRRVAAPLFIVFVGLAGAAAAFFLWKRGRDKEPGESASGRIDQGGAVAQARTTDAAPTPVAPADAAPVVAEQVTIDFVIVPSTATVYADDQPLPEKQLKVPRGDTPVKIRVEAPDFATRSFELVPNKDREVQLELLPQQGRPEELKSRPRKPRKTDEEDDPNAPSSDNADAGSN